MTGYAGIDHIARIREAVPPGFTGIIEHDPERPVYGGCAPNVAVGLARLGIRAAVAMVVGDDAEGRDYLRYLGDQRVDTRHVVVVPRGRTPRTYLFVPPRGPTSLFFERGAAADWDGPVEGVLDGASFAVLTVGPLPYNRRFAEAAIRRRLPLAWQLKGDVQAYPPEFLREVIQGSRYLFMNAQEGEYLRSALGAPSLEALGGAGSEGIFVTMGPSGCLVVTSEGSTTVPAVSHAIVDATGAGDGFTAGTLAGILRRWGVIDAARLGAVVASFTLEVVGAQAGLPTWEAAVMRYRERFGHLPERN